jgi:hypothetical protein
MHHTPALDIQLCNELGGQKYEVMSIGDILTIAQQIYPHSKTKAWGKEKKASDQILLPKHGLQESAS